MSFRTKPRRILRLPIPMLRISSKRPFFKRIFIAVRMLDLEVRDEAALVGIPYDWRECYVAGVYRL